MLPPAAGDLPGAAAGDKPGAAAGDLPGAAAGDMPPALHRFSLGRLQLDPSRYS